MEGEKKKKFGYGGRPRECDVCMDTARRAAQEKADESMDGLMIFKGGRWVAVEKDSMEERGLVSFHEIKYFYANIIDYVRVLLCCASYFTIQMNMPGTSAAIIYGSTLLDWVDGPVARAYGQCCIFGSGIDWLADIQAQLITCLWLSQLAPSVMPWIMLASTVEVAMCVFDFAVTATNRYPVLGRKSGPLIILEWTMPGGSYTIFGIFLWLAYPANTLAWCLYLSGVFPSSWALDSLGAVIPLAQSLANAVATGEVGELLVSLPPIVLWVLLYPFIVFSIMYIWCEAAQLCCILNFWKEAPRSNGLTAAQMQMPQVSLLADALSPQVDDGVSSFWGYLPIWSQKEMQQLFENSLKELSQSWEASLGRKDIYWVNLYQYAQGREPRVRVAGDDWIHQWCKDLVSVVYASEPSVELDGYGFIVNPIGSPLQPWHLDYHEDYSTVFIPLSQVTPANMTQYLVPAPSTSLELLAKVNEDTDRCDWNLLLREAEWVSVRQLLCRPFGVIKMDFGAMHRGISNVGNDHRTLFYISVRRHNFTTPEEPTLEVNHIMK